MRYGRIRGVYDPTLLFEMLMVKVQVFIDVMFPVTQHHMPKAFWLRLARSTDGEVENRKLSRQRLRCSDTGLTSATWRRCEDSTEGVWKSPTGRSALAAGLRMHSEQHHECDEFTDAEEGEKGMMCKVNETDPSRRLCHDVAALIITALHISKLEESLSAAQM